MTGGTFAEWQPRYAEAGIPIFPVVGKRPAVRAYLKTGPAASGRFVEKFGDASAFGFACKRAGLTIVDIDTASEEILSDTLERYGPTPIVVGTGSKHFQAWYRSGGEARRIRPDALEPIDILGGGYVVAPPSQGKIARYQFLSGGLENLPDLPKLKILDDQKISFANNLTMVGERNNTLWKACMRHAHRCSSFDDVLRFADEANTTMMAVPLPDEEVSSTAHSAWKITCAGENRFGREQRIEFSYSEWVELIAQPDALVLLGVLRAHNWHRREFIVANEMCKSMPSSGWSRKRFAAARSYLIAEGYLEQLRAPYQFKAALYRFL